MNHLERKKHHLPTRTIYKEDSHSSVLEFGNLWHNAHAINQVEFSSSLVVLPASLVSIPRAPYGNTCNVTSLCDLRVLYFSHSSRSPAGKVKKCASEPRSARVVTDRMICVDAALDKMAIFKRYLQTVHTKCRHNIIYAFMLGWNTLRYHETFYPLFF